MVEVNYKSWEFGLVDYTITRYLEFDGFYYGCWGLIVCLRSFGCGYLDHWPFFLASSPFYRKLFTSFDFFGNLFDLCCF